MSTSETSHEYLVGDCLELLKGLPDRSVDLVFTSPPYNSARTYSIGFNLRGEDWVKWALDRYMQCLRVSRGLVAWVVEGSTRNYRWDATPALLMADLHRGGVKLRNPPIMHRVGIPGSGGPDWLRNDKEFIICASHGKLPWSDNTAMGHPPRWAPGGAMSHRIGGRKRTQWGGSEKSGGHRKKDGSKTAFVRPSHTLVCNADERVQGGQYAPPVKANPGSVIRVLVGGGAMGHKLAHANEAPFGEDIAEFFIRSFCPPGGTVLDCFGGSGTTSCVAKRWGRNSLSIDIRESQREIWKERIMDQRYTVVSECKSTQTQS